MSKIVEIFFNDKYATCPICGSDAEYFRHNTLTYSCESYYNYKKDNVFTQSDKCKGYENAILKARLAKYEKPEVEK